VQTGFHLFQPRAAVRRVNSEAFYYYISGPAASVRAEVLDGVGRVVRTLTPGPASKAGLQRLAWDLRYPGATVFPGMIMRSAQPARGPLAPPGRYTVRITADGQTQARDFDVTRSPAFLSATDADLAEQFALAMKIRDKTSEANEAVVRIRALKDQVAARLEKTKDASITSSARRFVDAIAAVEEDLYQVKNRSPKDPLNYPVKINNRIAALQRVVESSEARPTDQSYAVFKLLSEELASYLARLDKALSDALPPLNALLAGAGLPPVQTP
jgi:hypothetical protein